MNKEQVYDEKISPLMAQIIQVVRENGIAMFASFAIGHDEGGPEGQDATTLTVTTHLPDVTVEPHQYDDRYNRCATIVRNGARPFATPVMHMTTTNPDGSKTMTAVIG